MSSASPPPVARAFVLGLFVLNLYLLYLVFRQFLPAIAWAVVLATAFYPVYAWLVRLLRGRQGSAAVLMSLLVAAVIVVPASLIVARIGNGLIQAYQFFEVQFSKPEGGMGWLQTFPGLASGLGLLGRVVDPSRLDLEGAVLSGLKTLSTFMAGQTTALVQNALATLLTLVVMLVTMAVLFRDGWRLLALIREILPISEAEKDQVLARLQDVTKGIFYGVIMTALIQAIVATAGYAAVGLPSPLVLGAITFFCALIPVGGTALVWAPASLFLFMGGQPLKGLGLLVWGLLAVSVVSYLLQPRFIGGRVQMHELLVFFGVVGGLVAFGMVGIFLGPLLIALFLFLVEVVQRDFLRPPEAPKA